MKSEFELIEKFKRKIPRHLQGLIGIGDDTAVLDGPDRTKWLFTTDAIVEGVDFVRNKILAADAGRKALAINLSDIAAMGGEPVACVITLGIPASLKSSWLDGFYNGIIQLAQKYRVQCVGGDITRAKEFFCSIAMLGKADAGKIITRHGAKPGDLIGVTGFLGGSILKHHYQFEPRIAEGKFLAEHFQPTAMMDISDGLLQDLGHILKASKVGANLDLESIPVSQDAKKLAGKHSVKLLEHALTDGEDFELLFTVPAGKRKKIEPGWKKEFPRVPLSWIGKVRSGRGIDSLKNEKPVQIPHFSKKGFSHF